MAEPASLVLDGGTVSATAREGTRALAGRAVGVVVGFWWLATGLIIAMQRSGPTRVLALLASTLLLCAGYWVQWRRAAETSAEAARRSFLGGALVWGWVSVTFYGGWIVGFVPDRAPPAPSWDAAWLAIRATLFSDLTALACMALAFALVRRAPNRAGAHALLAFWAMQQVAKLAVFFGVRNPAGNFLPVHLAHLRQFFGPSENAWFLFAGMGVFTVGGVWSLRRAAATATSGARQEAAMLAVLFALAVLELAILGVRLDPGFWDPFLAMRAGA